MSEERIRGVEKEPRNPLELTEEELDIISGGVLEQLHKGFNEEQQKK